MMTTPYRPFRAMIVLGMLSAGVPPLGAASVFTTHAGHATREHATR